MTHTASKQINRGVHIQLLARIETHLGEDATTYDCVNLHVKPATEALRCCYAQMALCSEDESLRRCIGTATVFVSHSWKYRYGTLVDIIGQRAMTSLTQAPDFYYIDIFAINQHDASRKGELDSLGQTIVDCGTLVLAASPWSSPLPLARVWCLYELHMATMSDVPIEMFISSSDTQAFFKALDHRSSEVQTTLANVDVRQACATMAEDRHNIFEQISGGVGFESFNRSIASTMRCSFSQLAMRRTLTSLTCKSSMQRTLSTPRSTQSSMQKTASTASCAMNWQPSVTTSVEDLHELI
eukprot:TRINITY_DN14424_c0_g1_i2.p1 TRINITY_DN14424_c0_g1~~TRINITY_DN14424_c0_g1_i2.p1  ORF type:complete len:298 (+),score=30.43 TRINITY_DN14424_c0_g1_i2:159-1052(+)